ncbi:MAG: SIMPL domain-containing protein [Bdellovibrionales bacterium]|nr:SIMPL domain-containing protein [Bdellovibrionales bacterium]
MNTSKVLWTFGCFSVFILSQEVWGSSVLDRKHIQVTGSCTSQVVPDRASTVLSSEFKEKDVATATRKASETYERIREAVRKLGLKDLQMTTHHYQVSEWTEWHKDTQKLLGYQVSIGLKVSTSEISRMGEIFAIAGAEKIKDIGSLALFLSHEKRDAEQLDCLKKAAADSRLKAERLALGLGVGLGSVLQIQEQYTNMAQPEAMAMADASGGFRGKRAGNPIGIEAGVIHLSVSVSSWFEVR